MTTKFVSQSTTDTLNFARDLASKLPRKTIILLGGDLGAGKTTFVRGFVSYWNIEDLVSSPTFTIMNEYKNDKITIYHFDLYRLNSPDELIELGLEDFIERGDYSLIEWHSIADDLLDGNIVQIHISLGDSENERIFLVDMV